MWNTFNALFVFSPMGHFTVGWLGKDMITIQCYIGAPIKSRYSPEHLRWLQTINSELFSIVCTVPNPDILTLPSAFLLLPSNPNDGRLSSAQLSIWHEGWICAGLEKKKIWTGGLQSSVILDIHALRGKQLKKQEMGVSAQVLRRSFAPESCGRGFSELVFFCVCGRVCVSLVITNNKDDGFLDSKCPWRLKFWFRLPHRPQTCPSNAHVPHWACRPPFFYASEGKLKGEGQWA